MNDIISWAGCILLLVGFKLVGDKKASGFYISGIAEVIWIVWALMTGSWALLFMSACILAVYVRNIIKWNKESK